MKFGLGFVKALSAHDQRIFIILIIKSKPSTRQDRQKDESQKVCKMRKKIYDPNQFCHFLNPLRKKNLVAKMKSQDHIIIHLQCVLCILQIDFCGIKNTFVVYYNVVFVVSQQNRYISNINCLTRSCFHLMFITSVAFDWVTVKLNHSQAL